MPKVQYNPQYNPFKTKPSTGWGQEEWESLYPPTQGSSDTQEQELFPPEEADGGMEATPTSLSREVACHIISIKGVIS